MKKLSQLGMILLAATLVGCNRSDDTYMSQTAKNNATPEARKEAKEGLNAPKPSVLDTVGQLTPPLPPDMEKNSAPSVVRQNSNVTSGENREEFIAFTDQRLKDLGESIDRLGEKIDSLQTDTVAKEKLKTLKDQRNEVSQRFDELKRASQEDWMMARVSFESAFDDFNRAYEETRSNYDH